MPYVALADGRDYALFPRAYSDPVPLDQNGKLYTKVVGGQTELFFQSDSGAVYQITPTGPSSITAVVWRPGIPSQGSAVATWSEVAAILAANQGAVTVYIDPTFGVPHVDAITNCFSATRFAPLSLSPSLGTNEIVIDDGAQLINPAIFAGNMTVRGKPTAINSALRS